MKKKALLLTLATSTLLLSSCGKISAEFPNENDPLTNSTIELDHNTLKVIYDSIKNSDNYESDVSSILTAAIAKEVIGDFSLVADETNGYRIVLIEYDVKEDGTATTDAEKTAFIESHPAYNNWEVSGYRLTLSEEAPTKEQFEERLKSIRNIIESQIITSIWNEANASDYKRNNRFYEVLFARHVYEQLYTVDIPASELSNTTLEEVLYKNPTYTDHYNEGENGAFYGFNDTVEDFHGLTNGVLIDGTYDTTTEDGREKIKEVLHINYYLDYINNTILPGIIENLLVEQYIFEQQYTAIGNTQSRKVNYISITDNSEKDANAFLSSFIRDYIISTNETNQKLSTEEKFDIVSTAWKGIDFEIAQNASAKAMADARFGASTTENPSYGLDGHNGANSYESYYATYDSTEANEKYFKYYENTEFADLVEQYSTLTNDPDTNNATNYETFTTIDSHNYDPVVGFTIKTDELIVKDFTTSGWQTRDASSLPDAIKNKLYSFSFVNEWNSTRETNDPFVGTYIYQDPVTQKSYLRKDSFSSTIDSLLWNDGDNYYIVEIEDIVTPSLVSITNDGEQSQKEKVDRENKARTIGYSLASSDTYTTNAITYYLEQCNINYHDQDVYDYFNTTYPDLFE